MDKQQLLELLSKPIWNRNDIISYSNQIGLPVKGTRAREIATIAKTKFDGRTPYGDLYVKSDSVLQVYSTTREEELRLLYGKEKNETIHD